MGLWTGRGAAGPPVHRGPGPGAKGVAAAALHGRGRELIRAAIRCARKRAVGTDGLRALQRGRCVRLQRLGVAGVRGPRGGAMRRRRRLTPASADTEKEKRRGHTEDAYAFAATVRTQKGSHLDTNGGGARRFAAAAGLSDSAAALRASDWVLAARDYARVLGGRGRVQRPLKRQGLTGDPRSARGTEVGAGRCAESISAGGRGRPDRWGGKAQGARAGALLHCGCWAGARDGPQSCGSG